VSVFTAVVQGGGCRANRAKVFLIERGEGCKAQNLESAIVLAIPQSPTAGGCGPPAFVAFNLCFQ